MSVSSHEDQDVELVIAARTRRIDDFDVGRVLPAPLRRTVGPFIFFDHMGPASLSQGRGMDVRPHPHIALSTVTYLFEGEIFHRDSLGSAQRISPGAINWMTAGKGIVHSERSPAEERTRGPSLHGLQLWVALPKADEECEPSFSHHPADTLPHLREAGAEIRVLAGEALGEKAPVPARSPLFYLDVVLEPGARLSIPNDYSERAAYVVTGEVRANHDVLAPRTMAVFSEGRAITLEASTQTHLVLLGGEPLDGPRYVFWNFVSSSQSRIEDAAREWREGRFPKVPGDEVEFIPLNDVPRFAKDSPSGKRTPIQTPE